MRERLGEPSLLGGSGVSNKTKKKRVVRSRPGTSSSSAIGGASESVADGASVVSAATTNKTKASQPDHMRLPAEYEKVNFEIQIGRTNQQEGLNGIQMYLV